MRETFFPAVIGGIIGAVFTSVVAFAWTGPSQTAPSGNVSAPVNIGTGSQVKNGNLSVNAFTGTQDSVFYGKLGVGSSAAPAYTLTVTNGNIGGAFGITPKYASWAAYGTGDGGAALYNDSGTYKKLMVVGNDSGGGSREVGIWDNLTVNGSVTAGNITSSGTYYGSGNINTSGRGQTDWYNINTGSIGAWTSIYSYGRICAGNSSGNCLGTGGTVIRSDGVQFPDGTVQTTKAGSAPQINGTSLTYSVGTIAIGYMSGQHATDAIPVTTTDYVLWNLPGPGTWKSYGPAFLVLDPKSTIADQYRHHDTKASMFIRIE